VDPVHTYGEPDIGIARNGATYVSGPWGTGTQRSIWNRSLDGGRTFLPLHDRPVTSTADSDTEIAGPGGGDTEISIARSGKVFYADLAALLTLKVATWRNRPPTMRVGTVDTPNPSHGGYDRQWFALWDPASRKATRKATGYTGPFPVNYLIYTEATGAQCMNLPDLCHDVRFSTDGITYSAPTVTSLDQNDGSATIDQRSGAVFMATSVKSSSDVGVDIYRRGKKNHKSPALRRVQQVKVADLPPGTSTGNAVPFPVVTMDKSRNLYLVWVTTSSKGKSESQDHNAWQVFYSYSRASTGWTHWSTPHKVNLPPARTNLFEWATAGTGGRLAIAWYGSTDAKHNPSTTDVHQAWNVYLAMINRAASATPHVTQVKVTPHPMHYGTICLEGLGCAAENPPGNRNLADFFQVTHDPRSGAVAIAYNDTSNELKQHPAPGAPPPEQADHRGAPVVTVIRQIRGIGVFGKRISSRPIRRRSLGDQARDARFDPLYGGVAVPQMDIRDTGAHLRGGSMIFRLQIRTLAHPQVALDKTRAGAVDYVMRWVGPKEKSPTGAQNPIYYAAVEITPSGTPAFFAGKARSVELCSVSGCFPHILEYPRPPQDGTLVKGHRSIITAKNGSKHYRWIIRVPLKLIGSPARGSRLQSFGAYTFARNKSASVAITNSEGEAGVTPILVDGACCKSLPVKP